MHRLHDKDRLMLKVYPKPGGEDVFVCGLCWERFDMTTRDADPKKCVRSVLRIVNMQQADLTSRCYM